MAESRRTLGIVQATIIALVVVAVVSSLMLGLMRLPHGGWRVRAMQHFYLSGRSLAVAFLLIGPLWLLQRRGWLTPRRGYPLLAVVCLAVGAWLLPLDADGFAHTILPPAPMLALVVLVAGVSLSVVAAVWLGRWFARRDWRSYLIALGAIPLFANPLILPARYRGAHLFVFACGVALIVSGLSDAEEPAWWGRVKKVVPWAFSGLVALFASIVPPEPELLPHMLRRGDDVTAPIIAGLDRLFRVEGKALPPPAWRAWFTPRDDHPAVPPSVIARPQKPVVVFITIDSLRADVLASGKYDRRWPRLAWLRDNSINFSRAYAPGAQTVYTLTEAFMGTYYSQQYWAKLDDERGLWPHEDDAVRFTDLLDGAGVHTSNIATARWLGNSFGIVRGFKDEVFAQRRALYAFSDQAFPHLVDRVKRHRDGSAFHFLHALDAHYTMRKHDSEGDYENYLRGIAKVDHQLDKLFEAFAGIRHRVYLVISSDHGEAFGEHGYEHHSATLYDELVRVPLLVYHRGLAPRTIDTPASLIDVAPTILDIFGLPTPGHFMGQSLMPLAAGIGSPPTRPIVAEGRLKKSLLFDDLTKVIVDDALYTREAYDTASDPAEARNLITIDRSMDFRIRLLRAFFDAHTIRRPGYRPPMRF